MGSPISQDVGVAVFAMTAPDFKTLLDARAQLIDEMYSGGFKAGEKFNSICESYVDYLWDIQLESSGN